MTLLPQCSNCVLDQRYFLGSFEDFSARGNNSSPTSVYWTKTPNQSIKFQTSGRLDVADSSELQTTSFSIVVYCDEFLAPSGNEYVFTKKDGGGSQFVIYWDASNVYVSDGSTTSQLGFLVGGAKNITITCNTGEKPLFYKNGSYQGQGNNTLTITTNDAPIKIGSDENNNNQLTSPLKGILLYNTALTAAQVEQAYNWTQEQFSPSYKKKNFYLPSHISGREYGVVAAWEMKSTAGKIIDLTGYGYDATLGNGISQTKIAGINALEFSGIEGAVAGSIYLGSQGTISCIICPNDLTGSKYYLGNGDGTSRIALASNTDDLLFNYYNGSVNCPSSENNCLTIGVPVHVIATWNGSESNLYINSVLAEGSTTASTHSATSFVIGARNDNNYGAVAKIAELVVYNRELSAAEINSLYLKYARLPVFIDDLKDANESVAAESGAYLSNTTWRIGSGSWKVSRDETNKPREKVIECVTNGVLYQESPQAYGTWEFDIYKNYPTNMSLYYIADVTNSVSLTGYQFYINSSEKIYVYRRAGGSYAAVELESFSSAITQLEWTSYRITRLYNGTSYVYAKASGGNWTLVEAASGSNPFVDANVTSSKYFVCELGAGDKITNIKMYNGVI